VQKGVIAAPTASGGALLSAECGTSTPAFKSAGSPGFHSRVACAVVENSPESPGALGVRHDLFSRPLDRHMPDAIRLRLEALSPDAGFSGSFP
jgi:hypothetical protein